MNLPAVFFPAVILVAVILPLGYSWVTSQALMVNYLLVWVFFLISLFFFQMGSSILYPSLHTPHPLVLRIFEGLARGLAAGGAACSETDLALR